MVSGLIFMFNSHMCRSGVGSALHMEDCAMLRS